MLIWIVAGIALFLAVVSALGVAYLIWWARSVSPWMEAASEFLGDEDSEVRSALLKHAKQTLGGQITQDRRQQKAMMTALVCDMAADNGPIAELLVNFPSVKAEIAKDPAAAAHVMNAARQLGLGEVIEEKGKALFEGFMQAKDVGGQLPSGPEVG